MIAFIMSLILLALRGAPLPAPVPMPTVVQVCPSEAVPTGTPSATPPPTAPPRTGHVIDIGPIPNQNDVSANLVLNPITSQSSAEMLLTIRLVNSGRTYVPFSQLPPWVIVRLVVTDTKGKRATYYEDNYRTSEPQGR